MIIVSQNNDHYSMTSILFNCNVNVELTNNRLPSKAQTIKLESQAY